MSRSLSDLRYELKSTGEVRVPRLTIRELAPSLSLVVAIVLVGIGIVWIAPFNWGILSVAATFWLCGLYALFLFVRDWRRQLVVTPTHLMSPGERPIAWHHIEKIGIPSGRSILSIQLTLEGFLGHFAQLNPEPDEVEFLASAEDRVVVWMLGEFLSDAELRFLREQLPH